MSSPSNPNPYSHELEQEEEDDEEEEEEEEDDIDFNPLFKRSLSPEPTSILTTSQSISLLIPDEKQQEPNSKNLSELDLGLVTEEDDLICRRTRARYSLANFSLDELETFLQETDDEEGFQNVDDEEEYRKFLTKVLNDEEESDPTARIGSDEEDESDDADFEIEIEEALESDFEEIGGAIEKAQNEKCEENGRRRPVTRRNRSRRSDQSRSSKKLLGQAKPFLRPILPASALIPATMPIDRMQIQAICDSRPVQTDLINGFTTHQIGQLYCLIHEHAQLLIQVFTLCVFEPSKQDIASDVKRMILDLVCTHKEILSRKRIHYPNICFSSPYISPSVSEDLPDSNRNVDAGQLRPKPFWAPLIQGLIFSILDVAPLGLMEKYVEDVTNAMLEYSQRHLHPVHGNSHFEKVPLFPLPQFTPMNEAMNSEMGLSSMSGREEQEEQRSQQPKKTLAGALVESCKKQSVALVPTNIVNLAQRFLPLFNSALFPHKPPPVAVTNRLLFTDAEDELLALGLLEYNHDWKAIQQRFLPCKTKHQIFVRAKNRSSSKVPENPIKAVRQMKTAPLTEQEKALIQEGLKIFKLDWISVWKFLVPHRDPSLLPRQWRTALGTQKSYKMDEAAKAKRRLYETTRRKKSKAKSFMQIRPSKEVNSADGMVNSGDDNTNMVGAANGLNNCEDDNINEEDEVYMHAALLADYKPKASRPTSLELPLSSVGNHSLPVTGILSQEGPPIPENWSSTMDGYQRSFEQKGSNHELVATQNSSYTMKHTSQFTHVRYSTSCTVASHKWSKSLSRTTGSRHQMLKSNTARLVKLAPDLPPVNLPPSVRVISQSSLLKTGGSSETPMGISLVSAKNKASLSNDENSRLQKPITSVDQIVSEENGVESDLRLHPLLFQVPQSDSSPYFLHHNGTMTSTFNFFPESTSQENTTLAHEPQRNQIVDRAVNHFHPSLTSKEAVQNVGTVDFHPFLQSSVNVNSAPVVVSSETGLSCHLERNSDPCVADGSGWTTTSISTYPYGKPNRLNFDINLNSAAGSDKMIENGKGTEHNQSGSSTGALMHEIIEGNQRSTIENTIPTTALQSTEDDVDDQSLPGIVMEREELSDSDEEMEEDVQFECEEMTDSEGEGLDLVQTPNLPNKETPASTVEEVLTNGDCDKEGKICVTRKSVRSCRPIETAKLKSTGNSTQLCSTSSTPGPLHPKQKRGRGNKENKSGDHASNGGCSRPSRSRRKRNTDASSSQHPVDERVHLSRPDLNTVPSKRKPRKRLCKMDFKTRTTGNSENVSSENCGTADESNMRGVFHLRLK